MFSRQLQFSFQTLLQALKTSTQKNQHANEALKGFIRYIFHEVRVPLNAVILAIEQLREHGQLNSNDQEIVDILKDQATVVSGILNDVLTIQRIEEGKLSLHFEMFYLPSLCDFILRSFNAAASDKQVSLLSNVSAIKSSTANRPYSLPSLSSSPIPFNADYSSCLVIGDRMRIGQCLSNLISNGKHTTTHQNKIPITFEIVGILYEIVTTFVVCVLSGVALKFSGAQTDIRFTLSLSSLSPSEETSYYDHLIELVPEYPSMFHQHSRPLKFAKLYFSVEDQGIGMSSTDQKKLFKRFQQVGGKQTDEQRFGSSGLGLNITKSLVELMGGEIGMESTEGKGRSVDRQYSHCCCASSA